jgi:hypothetical protein
VSNNRPGTVWASTPQEKRVAKQRQITATDDEYDKLRALAARLGVSLSAAARLAWAYCHDREIALAELDAKETKEQA